MPCNKERTINVATMLVTGGAGFIGSNFIRFAYKLVDKIVNFDKMTYAANMANCTGYDREFYTFERGDIACEGDVEWAFKRHKPDYLVNFAAESHVDRSISNAAPFVTSNVRGVQVLLDACVKYGIKRFVHVSTDEVYGSLGTDDLPFTEDSPIRPNSPYAASKAAADMFVRAYHETHKLDTIITRCSNNYGPYQFPEKLIPLAIMRLRDHKKVPIYGSGKQVRDWIFVTDHCNAIWKALTVGTAGSVYNFGGNAERTNIQIVNELVSLLVKPADSVEYVKDRPGHDQRYAMDYTKATKEIGWYPTVKFKEGLERTVRWYVHNSTWLDDVVSKEYLQYYQHTYGADA